MNKLKVKRLDINYGGQRVIALNDIDAEVLGLHPYDRVKIISGDKHTIAITALTKTFVERGYVGIFKETADALNVKNDDIVEIIPSEIPISLEYIRKRLFGKDLKKDEIYIVVKDIVDGSLSDVEIAAFLVSQIFRKMDIEEISFLTRAMFETGDKIVFDKPVYDIHSIGGVPGNSKVALLEVPIVAVSGLLIPKTSSRAITSPAGTADTMEVLANVSLEPKEIKKKALKVGGLLLWAGKLKLAPADDVFIRVERPLRIDPKSQTVASILSKKLAMSVKHLVIDIPVGKGTKMTTMEDATHMARLFTDVGEKININVKCAITYGGQPIGYYIGPALEAREAIIALQKKEGAMSLIEKATSLAGLVFEMAGLVTKGSGQDLAKQIFYSGKAWEKMKEIIEAQGGNPNIKPEDIPIGDKSAKVTAPMDGYITDVDNTAITLIAKTAGAPKDKGAGIVLHVKAGSKVKRGDILFEIYAENENKLSTAYNLISELHPIKLEGMLLRTFPE